MKIGDKIKYKTLTNRIEEGYIHEIDCGTIIISYDVKKKSKIKGTTWVENVIKIEEKK